MIIKKVESNYKWFVSLRGLLSSVLISLKLVWNNFKLYGMQG